jgi:HEPN domain-containing protein
MKSTSDLVKGWVRKAESDLENTRMCLDSDRALDTACFHAQQAAEKYLKAYMTSRGLEFPFVHNLEKLIEICAETEADFLTIRLVGADLTPYAVELRYDDEFWPDMATARHAYAAALAIKELVLRHLPPDLSETTSG